MPVPDFVLELRRRIGQAPLWLPGITAVVVRDGSILLVRRSDNGAWTPVTGIVDPGEHPALAAVREVQEETGVVCRVERLALVNVSPPIVHANGDHAQYLDHTFRCSWVAGEPYVADDESSAVRWCPVAELPPMAEQFRARLAAALADETATRL